MNVHNCVLLCNWTYLGRCKTHQQTCVHVRVCITYFRNVLNCFILGKFFLSRAHNHIKPGAINKIITEREQGEASLLWYILTLAQFQRTIWYNNHVCRSRTQARLNYAENAATIFHFMRYYAAIMCVTLLERGSWRRRTHGREGIPLPVGNYAARGLGALGGLPGRVWAGHGNEDTATQRHRCL